MELKKDSKRIIIEVIIGVIVSSILSIISIISSIKFLFITIPLIILGITIYLIKYKMNKKEEPPVLIEQITNTPEYIGYVEYPDKKMGH